MTPPATAKTSPVLGLTTELSTGAGRLRPVAGGQAHDQGDCYQRLLRQLLAPMQRGHLVIQDPDGTRHDFGSAQDALRAREPLGISARATILVRDHAFYRRCVLGGDIGFGESYVHGEWDSPDLPAVVAWFLRNVEDAPALSGSRRRGAGGWLRHVLRLVHRWQHLRRPNSRAGAARNIHEHYDLSNAFFAEFLDPAMMYSGARWTRPDQTLAEAQEEKNAALCRQLRLRPTDRVLEIGCGWGGWAIHAARHHGSRITTITLSEQQFTAAWDRVQAAGVSDRVDVQLADFRDLRGRFDKIVSIEMMEALGHRYLPEFCRFIARSLRPEGLAAFQFITCPDSRYGQFRRGVDFIQKHIFPGSLLLSLNRVNQQLARAGGFMLHGLDDLGHDYGRTLRAWRERFEERQEAVAALGFDERFRRKWRYYLAYCEAAFAMRNISVVQALYTRPNNLELA